MSLPSLSRGFRCCLVSSPLHFPHQTKLDNTRTAQVKWKENDRQTTCVNGNYDIYWRGSGKKNSFIVTLTVSPSHVLIYWNVQAGACHLTKSGIRLTEETTRAFGSTENRAILQPLVPTQGKSEHTVHTTLQKYTHTGQYALCTHQVPQGEKSFMYLCLRREESWDLCVCMPTTSSSCNGQWREYNRKRKAAGVQGVSENTAT